jgi:hypothetical protein
VQQYHTEATQVREQLASPRPFSTPASSRSPSPVRRHQHENYEPVRVATDTGPVTMWVPSKKGSPQKHSPAPQFEELSIASPPASGGNRTIERHGSTGASVVLNVPVDSPTAAPSTLPENPVDFGMHNVPEVTVAVENSPVATTTGAPPVRGQRLPRKKVIMDPIAAAEAEATNRWAKMTYGSRPRPLDRFRNRNKKAKLTCGACAAEAEAEGDVSRDSRSIPRSPSPQMHKNTPRRSESPALESCPSCGVDFPPDGKKETQQQKQQQQRPVLTAGHDPSTPRKSRSPRNPILPPDGFPTCCTDFMLDLHHHKQQQKQQLQRPADRPTSYHTRAPSPPPPAPGIEPGSPERGPVSPSASPHVFQNASRYNSYTSAQRGRPAQPAYQVISTRYGNMTVRSPSRPKKWGMASQMAAETPAAKGHVNPCFSDEESSD